MPSYSEKVPKPTEQSLAQREPVSKKSSTAPDLAKAEPTTPLQAQRQEAVNQSPRLTGLLQRQAIVNRYLGQGSQPIQLGRKSKKANWSEKLKAQNRRLLERRERRAREAAEREAKLAADTAATTAHMKRAQKESFDEQSEAVQRGIIRLHSLGFVQQNTSGRAVFNKPGTFADCKRDAERSFGGLGPNREDGVAVNANGDIKERYMINWQGITVIVRNFSSNAAINGTIELQTGVVFEFKFT